MDAVTFFQKLKQHCTEAGNSCRQCCFLNFCYCRPCDYTEELLSASIARFSSSLSTNGQGLPGS